MQPYYSSCSHRCLKIQKPKTWKWKKLKYNLTPRRTTSGSLLERTAHSTQEPTIAETSKPLSLGHRLEALNSSLWLHFSAEEQWSHQIPELLVSDVLVQLNHRLKAHAGKCPAAFLRSSQERWEEICLNVIATKSMLKRQSEMEKTGMLRTLTVPQGFVINLVAGYECRQITKKKNLTCLYTYMHFLVCTRYINKILTF